jgi:hypothetical protein
MITFNMKVKHKKLIGLEYPWLIFIDGGSTLDFDNSGKMSQNFYFGLEVTSVSEIFE